MSIQEVTIYRTPDGSEFRSREAASAYVGRVARLAGAMSPLPELPSGTDFQNGHGYIQHDYAAARTALNAVLDLIEEKTGAHNWISDTRTKGPVEAHPSWVYRLISDYDDNALSRAWLRFVCIDWATMREYGQRYYAAHPAEADGGCLNCEAVGQ